MAYVQHQLNGDCTVQSIHFEMLSWK